MSFTLTYSHQDYGHNTSYTAGSGFTGLDVSNYSSVTISNNNGNVYYAIDGGSYVYIGNATKTIDLSSASRFGAYMSASNSGGNSGIRSLSAKFSFN